MSSLTCVIPTRDFSLPLVHSKLVKCVLSVLF